MTSNVKKRKRDREGGVKDNLLDEETGFDRLGGLDDRLLRAVANLKYAHPTLVQAKAVPLALQGRDILARARTGSGKTVAYLLPLLQKILTCKAGAQQPPQQHSGISALVLVPTRELSEQVFAQCEKLSVYCRKEIRVVNIAGGGTSEQVHRSTLAESKPDVVIATPARIMKFLDSSSLSLQSLQSLVIDEADLILSYGYEEDMQRLLGIDKTKYLSSSFQTYLMSATLTQDVQTLKSLALRNPAILTLQEDEQGDEKLIQYLVRTTEEDKFLLLFVILKLKLIKGKCLIFANDVDRSYRIKLFLERFSIRSCVLNSELPINSRYHVVEEFNRGIYDYIIATDESSQPVNVDPSEGESRPKKKSQHGKKDKAGANAREYGVSRGIDFVNVSCVINFDFPTTSITYTHRIGRTARAGQSGTALSFVVMQDAYQKGLPKAKAHHLHSASAEFDQTTVQMIMDEQASSARGVALENYQFDMEQANAFRYRVEDALRSVTRASIHEARLKEMKEELINSSKLKAHFEDNPKDLAYLRHDRPLHTTRTDPHLKHVPSYLMPRIASMASELGNGGEKVPDFVPFRKPKKGQQSGKKRKVDPLKRKRI